MSLHFPKVTGLEPTVCVNCEKEIRFNTNSRRYSSSDWNSIQCNGGSN